MHVPAMLWAITYCLALSRWSDDRAMATKHLQMSRLGKCALCTIIQVYLTL
jgi:hypothetical protein